MTIHPTAVVSEKAEIAPGVSIGPYCTVGPHVVLDADVQLISHVVVDGFTTIGQGTILYPFACIGSTPQHLGYKGEKTTLSIGRYTHIREHVTIHPGTSQGQGHTHVGDHCLIMGACHIAHDCHIGNHVIMANNATLGGHVKVGDRAVLGGLSAVHQYTHIGAYAMLGGASALGGNIIPYGLARGNIAYLEGLNIRGLKRQGFSREEIQALRQLLKFLFHTPEPLAQKLTRLPEDLQAFPAVQRIRDFLLSNHQRPLCLPPAEGLHEMPEDEEDSLVAVNQ